MYESAVINHGVKITENEGQVREMSIKMIPNFNRLQNTMGYMARLFALLKDKMTGSIYLEKETYNVLILDPKIFFMQNPCPCNSSLSYVDCCEPIISGRKEVITAQELMRSRYTAFTQANVNYLMRSHSAKTRPIKERKSIEKWAKSVTWLGLTIIQSQDGETKDETGFVEFKALYLENGKPEQIHEKSLFRRENGKWVYVSGVSKV
jgi:SEC-C motif-containing protein